MTRTAIFTAGLAWLTMSSFVGAQALDAQEQRAQGAQRAQWAQWRGPLGTGVAPQNLIMDS